MMTGSHVTKRRTLLQRGFALLAGGAALAGGTRWAAASPPTAAPNSLTLYSRRRPVASLPGASHADGRIVASGDLLDAPGGARVGAFHTNCFCAQSPFGPQSVSASNLEFHVLQLTDGTLFAIGSGLEDAGAAIVGGTGRYAGRSGSYIQRAIADPSVGADVRQLMITFAG
jgi:hypothetical protein